MKGESFHFVFNMLGAAMTGEAFVNYREAPRPEIEQMFILLGDSSPWVDISPIAKASNEIQSAFAGFIALKGEKASVYSTPGGSTLSPSAPHRNGASRPGCA